MTSEWAIAGFAVCVYALIIYGAFVLFKDQIR